MKSVKSWFFPISFASLIATLLLVASSCQAGTWQITYAREGSDTGYYQGTFAWDTDPNSFQFDPDGYLYVGGIEDFGSVSSGGNVSASVTWVPDYTGELPPPVYFVETTIVEAVVDTWEDNQYYAFADNSAGGTTYSGHPLYGGSYVVQQTGTKTTLGGEHITGIHTNRGVSASAGADYGMVHTNIRYRVTVVPR